MVVTLYTTGCPKCDVLEKKLRQKDVAFDVVSDGKKIEELGFSSAPLLVVDGEVMEFTDAVKWINGR